MELLESLMRRFESLLAHITKILFPLYDNQFIRRQPDFDPRGSAFLIAMLKRDADFTRNLRNNVETWYAKVRRFRDDDLRARLRSDNDRQFEPALYELLVHELLHRFVGRAHWKPELPDGRPEFLLRSRGVKAIVEVATLLRTPEQEQAEHRIQDFRREVDKHNLTYSLGLELKEHIPLSINLREVSERLVGIIPPLEDGQLEGRKIDLDAVGLKGFAQAQIRGFESTLPPVERGTEVKRIRRVLVQKARKYKSVKKQQIPFVVVMCAGQHVHIGLQDMLNALYGTEQIIVGLGRGGPPLGSIATARRRDGLVTPPKPTRYTRVSAIIFCALDVAEDLSCTCYVLHNPWAQNRLPASLFTRFPQLLFRDEGSPLSGEWTQTPVQSIPL
ncbi:MAG: hypothetical protein O7D32_08785 [bacterium]|nr:hypothetical protein [bacterium]